MFGFLVNLLIKLGRQFSRIQKNWILCWKILFKFIFILMIIFFHLNSKVIFFKKHRIISTLRKIFELSLRVSRFPLMQ